MKSGGKRKTTTEAPNDVSAVDFGTDGIDESGGHGDDGNKDASFTENENTQLQKGETEVTQVEDSEEDDADEEEGEGDEEEAQLEDGVPFPGLGLGNGFFEVEAIRRKRVRKGQVQYFIKWRDWPETENTWEPPENLAGVPDVVEAFEQSLRSGKLRKRRRKHVVHHAQLKKRLERSATPYSLRRFPTSTAENHSQAAPLTLSNPSIPDIPAFPQPVLFADEVENNGDGSSLGTARHTNDNRSVNAPEEVMERNEENDYDPKLSELRTTSSNGNDADNPAIQFQEAKPSAGNCHTDDQSTGICTESVQNDGRCRGAKRRKSGSVKRFKQDLDAAPDVTPEAAWTGISDKAGSNNLPKTEQSKPAGTIVKILKPVGYTASVASTMQQDVLVTFVAMRSDGTEVLVDNKFLKTYNPLLLINFYEQHLRYSPT